MLETSPALRESGFAEPSRGARLAAAEAKRKGRRRSWRKLFSVGNESNRLSEFGSVVELTSCRWRTMDSSLLSRRVSSRPGRGFHSALLLTVIGLSLPALAESILEGRICVSAMFDGLCVRSVVAGC